MSFLRNEMFNARNYFDQPIQKPNGTLEKHAALPPAGLWLHTWEDPSVHSQQIQYRRKDRDLLLLFGRTAPREDPSDLQPGRANRQPSAQGDFSDVCPAYVPASQWQVSTSPVRPTPIARFTLPMKRSPLIFPGFGLCARINVSYHASALLATRALSQLPNSTIGCNTTNPTAHRRAVMTPRSRLPTYWREELFRIDHNLTPRQQLILPLHSRRMEHHHADAAVGRRSEQLSHRGEQARRSRASTMVLNLTQHAASRDSQPHRHLGLFGRAHYADSASRARE
jgi:hypothetical protein